jgi:hypothetical protein
MWPCSPEHGSRKNGTHPPNLRVLANAATFPRPSFKVWPCSPEHGSRKNGTQPPEPPRSGERSHISRNLPSRMWPCSPEHGSRKNGTQPAENLRVLANAATFLAHECTNGARFQKAQPIGLGLLLAETSGLKGRDSHSIRNIGPFKSTQRHSFDIRTKKARSFAPGLKISCVNPLKSTEADSPCTTGHFARSHHQDHPRHRAPRLHK